MASFHISCKLACPRLEMLFIDINAGLLKYALAERLVTFSGHPECLKALFISQERNDA